mgnify:CR=1 FL=1
MLKPSPDFERQTKIKAMTLEEFRLSKNLTYGQLSRMLGVTHTKMVHRWCKPFDDPERQIPGKYMDVIVRATHGAVTPNDFYIKKMF